MGTEIERKFRVRGDGWPRADRGIRYRQGYLSTDPDRCVRVRAGETSATLTVKGRVTGLSRPEFEFEIPAEDARHMLEHLCVRPLIDKTRYRIEHGGLVWEIDEFHGDNEGLVVAEVELDEESTAVVKPDWVAEEVSADPRYYNMRLVQRPFRDWSEAERG